VPCARPPLAVDGLRSRQASNQPGMMVA
jgi:hypothetical protein